MDEGLSQAVLKVFVDLYKQGLIYKDKRLVNWDPKFQTAISDLEVQQVEVKGNLWHIRYAIEGKPDRFDHRGDHAARDDARRRGRCGSSRRRALQGSRRQVRDPAARRPAHPDRRRRVFRPGEGHRRGEDHARRTTSTISRSAAATSCRSSTSSAPRRNLRSPATRPSWKVVRQTDDLEAVLALDGLDRFEARKRIVAMLEERELLVQIEPHTHTVPHGDRSGVVIEPYLTDQWYVNVKPLAERALGAVRAGQDQVRAGELGEDLLPVAREHRAVVRLAPALVGPPDSRPGMTRRATSSSRSARRRRKAQARAKHGRDVPLTRDEDVLDTWFSSALWPFSTLGWPDDTPELDRYYPTNTLVTGLRHHLLLGRPHDDDGPALHGRGALRHGLHPRPRPRREGRQDVEVERQRHRSARRDRAVRRRCPAHDARRHGRAGARHQAVRPARRGLPQLRDQDLERGALCRDERLPARRRLRSEIGEGDAQQLGAQRMRQGRSTKCRPASRATSSTRRRSPPTASSGTCSATGRSNSPSPCCRARIRPPRTRPAPPSPSSSTRSASCCIPSCPSSRRSCGRSRERRGRSARRSSRSRRGRDLARSHRRRGRGRDRLGGGPRQRDPLRPVRDQRAGRRPDPARAGRVLRRCADPRRIAGAIS